MKSLVWFRRDLRVNDHSALYHAAQAAAGGVVGLFVISPGQWIQHDEAPAKVNFWLRNLKALSESLQTLNIPLLIREVPDYDQVPQLIVDTCQQLACDSLFFNREYEVNESSRDRQTVALCSRHGIHVNQFHDRVLVPPHAIKTREDRFYSVFTPYRKVWDTRFGEFAKGLPAPQRQPPGDDISDPVPEAVAGFDSSVDWPDRYPAGEAEAARRLDSFSERVNHYQQRRDFPSVDGTSGLSPYLAAGVVSPRQCLTAADHCGQRSPESIDEGATVWVSELTWRDFYHHVLVGFPRVSRHQPFKLKTRQISWRTDQQDFRAWSEGRTGYPIVDAGMRQLNQTGWMHNRLRMVTAMFLTKNLLIDWQMGERHFMTHLIDGDLAANNGGWQWSASTGTDSVPYFRIFNPFSQSKRFDPDGTFIKLMCPELQPVPPAALHDPVKLKAALEKRGIDYPGPIVDYKLGRERALNAFKSL